MAGSRRRWDLINYRSCSSFTRLFDRVVSSRLPSAACLSISAWFSPVSPSFLHSALHRFVLSLELRRVALCPTARPFVVAGASRRNEFLPRLPCATPSSKLMLSPVRTASQPVPSCNASATGALFVLASSRTDLWILQIQFCSGRCSCI